MQKNVKVYFGFAALLTAILGTLSHFCYEWSGRLFLVGLVTPVSESIWEHCKLLFFPMALCCFYLVKKLHASFPSIGCALSAGNLIGCILIPVLYYTYTGVTGLHSTVVDVLIFLVSVLCAYYSAYRLILREKTGSYCSVYIILCILLAAAFFLFTYYPPKLPLFLAP